MREILVLRPEPGASETRERAKELGLDPIVAPIFKVETVAWEPPAETDFDAVLLTSANAARHAGQALCAFYGLPCYVVGESSAAAAHEAGFRDVRTGPSDGAALVEIMADDGISTAFHPHGLDHLRLDHPQIRIVRRGVYASHAVEVLPPEAAAALGNAALVLLHSPRTARHFAMLLEDSGRPRRGVDLALISKAAATAAGPGWKSVSVASVPRDHALLELAAKLCKTGTTRMESGA